MIYKLNQVIESKKSGQVWVPDRILYLKELGE